VTLPEAVLFDFTGTLFAIEDAHSAVVAALGPDFASFAPALKRWSAINGSGTPADLPADLADVWERRDLSRTAHRDAYSGLAVHAGLTAAQAEQVYDRGVLPAAWHPFPDTVEVLQRLRAAGVPTALLSNIGWDPRPVLSAYGVDGLLDGLVLSDERGVMKPDPAIFRLACAELAVDPADTLMVGDNADTDGAATAIGCRFALVASSPDRPPDTLLRAVGLTP
jgi:HAD superfamily hydrolase (TIGR01509 family)